MKLKPVKRGVPAPTTPQQAPAKKPRKSSKNTLPSDEYKPIYTPYRFLVSDKPSTKDDTQRVKHYLEVSAKRVGDDTALPMCYVSTYQESAFYTGYLKGKSITLPITEIATLVEALTDLEEKCCADGLVDEYE